MRKMLSAALIVCMVALLSLLSMPVHATPPTQGSGSFDMSIPETTTESWFAGGNIIMHMQGGGGHDYGTFEGIWIHDEWDVVHLATGIVTFKGVWDSPYGMTVDGVTGTVHVSYWGTADAATGAFQGKWVIISGTGGLANLRGQGTMGWEVSATYGWYTIQYHFEP
jgi:hypothetical protein